MTATDALSIIVAAIAVPLVTAVMSKPDLSATTKRGIALAAAVLLGTVSAIISGQLDGMPADATAWVVRIVIWVGTIAAAGQAMYQQIKPATDAIEGYTPKRAQ